jgi:hypothetical protein
MRAKLSAGGPKVAGNSWLMAVPSAYDVISNAPTWGRNAAIGHPSGR